MNKIYNLLIKSIKHIETESNKYKKKEEDISSKWNDPEKVDKN